MNLSVISTDDKCASCGNPLLTHTMWFQADGVGGLLIDTTKPIKCPLGQAADWIEWEAAWPEEERRIRFGSEFHASRKHLHEDKE